MPGPAAWQGEGGASRKRNTRHGGRSAASHGPMPCQGKHIAGLGLRSGCMSLPWRWLMAIGPGHCTDAAFFIKANEPPVGWRSSLGTAKAPSPGSSAAQPGSPFRSTRCGRLAATPYCPALLRDDRSELSTRINPPLFNASPVTALIDSVECRNSNMPIRRAFQNSKSCAECQGNPAVTKE